MTDTIRVIRAKRIHTMSRNRPIATHAAISDGRILAVGDAADCARWNVGKIDDRFADRVLMPGLVEAHAHAMEGGVWKDLFLGYFRRHAPDGRLEGGLGSPRAVIERLKEREAQLDDPDAPLLAWGFDPIYFGAARLTRLDLDEVSTTRPILIIHASFHLMTVNSVVLMRGGMDKATGVEGILRDPNGMPTGELREMAAMFMAQKVVGDAFALRDITPDILGRFAQSAVNAGVTTCTDLHQKLTEGVVAAYVSATSDEDFPLRCVPALAAVSMPPAEGIRRMEEIRRLANDRFHPGPVKVMTDGSIQGFSARLKWPGYHNGAPNGIWNMPPAQLRDLIRAYNAARIQMHLHVNGDQASEFAIDVLTGALADAPFPDHRHVLQHCQMADESQFRRMAATGICANLFANHIYFWGDQHHALTMGPDRAQRMDACATALASGVPLAIHSDAPITPLAPLFTAWCAVNRRTASGRVLGAEERISVPEALRAITLGAAWQLKLDHLVGSIEVGKFADFAVLEDDPFEVPPEALKDIRIAGTLVSGRFHASRITGAPPVPMALPTAEVRA
ncbi:amidohydrolase [Falsirhodobacter algicola]|uniref:Amidohydrolase family protein n=1 Tax=Falsirhodobacter algicola TaxID=2692330 RepID=A0A8J8MTT3_9RHOB|nr:amidohydrolase [Falsirhodobacter algicola]QUS36322.1 amidohydrolase family protein [Falsirhodobacter algicola]